MRGKHYNPGSRRVFSGGGYIGVIIAIFVIAALVAITLLVLLPTTKPLEEEAPNIVSISYDKTAIGVGSDLSQIYVTVVYNNGDTKEVALSSIQCEGLDVTVDGTQNVSLNYGGFEQTIAINVKNVDCVLTYTAGNGGRIQGTAVQTVVSGSDAATVRAVPETGYSFKEWSDGYPLSERTDKSVNESREYLAKFTKTKFNVTFFFYDGTAQKTEQVNYGESAINIPDETDPRMVVYGYKFVGWSVAEEDYRNVKRDVNVYPRYEKTATDVSVEVSVDKYGQIMGETDAHEYGYYAQSDVERATIIASPNPSTTFVGWEVRNSDGDFVFLGRTGLEETVVEIGDNHVGVSFRVSAAGSTDSYSISFFCTSQMEYVELKADFAYLTSTVTFINYQNKYANNVEGTVDDVAYNETIGEKIERAGISTDDDVDLVIDDGEYSANRGLPIPNEVAGMTFLGWYMQTDPTQSVITAQQTFIEPTNLIAKWEKNEYKLIYVYYDEDMNEVVYDDSTVVLYQNTVGSGGGIPAGVPYKDCYTFTGWYDAYTNILIDDATQIIKFAEYDNGDDFANGRIRILAAWTAVAHKLTVDIVGEGTVEVTDDDGITVEVLGETEIYENHKYRATFRANEGYEIRSVVWIYGEESDPFSGSTLSASGSFVTIDERQDNTLNVTFEPKSFSVTIHNGDEFSSGFIKRTLQNGESAMYDAEWITDWSVNYGAGLFFEVNAVDESYAIKQITASGYFNGRSYSDEVIFTKTETPTIYLPVTFTDCRSDITVSIEYETILYVLSVSQTPYGEGENDYYIMETTLSGRQSDMSVPSGQKEYSHGQTAYFQVNAQEDEYITSVLFDGMVNDVYTGSDSVIFYDWEVNGQSIGITLKLIDGVYYYCYGMLREDETYTYSIPVDGYENSFLYCQRVSDGRTFLFEVVDEEAGDYILFDMPANAPGAGRTLQDVLYAMLNIAQRDLFDASVLQNRMVTSVKIAIKLDKNLNLAATFAPIVYSVNVEESEFADVYVSADTVEYGGSVTLSVKTVTGYRLVGGTCNGREMLIGDPTESFEITYNNVAEDLAIVFRYEVIRYNVMFVNTKPQNGGISVQRGEDNFLLNNSYSFVMEYASGDEFLINTTWDKALLSVKVDGVEQTLLYNTTEYKYTNYYVTKAVRIEVYCGDRADDDYPDEGYYVSVNEADNVSGTVRYDVDKEGGSGKENHLILVAEKGYKFKSASIVGVKNGAGKIISVDFAQALPEYVTLSDNEEQVIIHLATDEFDEDTVPRVSCTVEAKSFTLTTEARTEDGINGGSISEGVILYYGKETTITVNADASEGYYISSFTVNGKEISFVSDNWRNKVASVSIGKYSAGNYVFTASEDVNVVATFSKISYKVTLDRNSINGTTEFYIEDNTEGNNSVLHGADFIISMSANAGYHISRILLNGQDAGYTPYTDVSNDNTMDTFIVQSVTENVNVYVVYEINRYAFTYRLVNDSVNFQSEDESASGNSLTCADAVAMGSNTYGNIAYGDNFSFIVTPGISKGYYVYSIKIEYSGYKEKSRIRYAGDGFSANGGTIWFNRFLWDNNLAGSVGVTADIQLIEVTFKKKLYTVGTTQEGTPEGGTLFFAVTNSLSSDGRIYFFDGEGDDATRYMYNRTSVPVEINGVSVLRDVITISRLSGTEYLPTDYQYTYFSDGEEIGRWVLYSETENSTLDMYLEYGLRYTVYTYNTEGYELSMLDINGDSKLRNVYNKAYSFNVYGTGVVRAKFTILTFDVLFSAVVYQSNNAEVPTRSLLDYVNLRILGVNGEEREELGVLEQGANSILLRLDYGTSILLEITPEFDAKGAYIHTLQRGNTQMNLSEFDVMDVVTFGGEGIRVVNDITYKATLKIREYTVTISSVYEETYNGEYITNETKNSVSNDATGALRWIVSWGNDTVAKIIKGEGYYVDRVELRYTTKDNTETIVIEDYEAKSASFGGAEIGYSVMKEVEDSLYGHKDNLTMHAVKGDYQIYVYFARQEFDLIYTVTPLSYIDNVRTQVNVYNATYPTREENSIDSGWQIKTHYHDELTVTITPKDGYKLVSNVITIYCLEFDAETGTYQPKLDQNNRRVDYELSLMSTGNGDEMSFSFRASNSAIAQHVVSSTIRIQIELNIKEYRMATTVSTTQIDVLTVRDTLVTTTVKDMVGNNLIVANAEQLPKEISGQTGTVTMTAQHHGTIQYVFTTPVGYTLSSFVVNGFTFEELAERSIVASSVMTKLITREKDSVGNDVSVVSYYYNIVLNVNSVLLKGSTSPWAKTSDIVTNIALAPVTYQVRIVLNGQIYDVTSVAGRTGVTDGKQISVYVPATVLHFGTLNVEPVMYTGYEIKDGKTNVYFGTESGYTLSSGDIADCCDSGAVIRSRSDFYLKDGMTNSDATIGKTYIYFVFNTGIIQYKEEITATVFYSVSDGEGGYVSMQRNLNENNAAGSVVITVIPREGSTSEVDLGDYSMFTQTLDYFTVLRITAKAKNGYVLYGIYEITDDIYGNKQQTAIVNGIRQVTYTVSNTNEYVVYITVADLSTQILGNRKFLFDFRQQTQVTLSVANPYKYISTTRRYASYVNVTAYSSSNMFESGVPAANTIINRDSTEAGVVVVETYTFTVYVGNYIKFVITDKYSTAAPEVAFYNYNLYDSAAYAFDEALGTKRKDDLGLSGHGIKIDGASDFYAYINVNARISVSQTSVSALGSQGGTIYFNNTASTTGILNDVNTAPGKTLTISVKPNDNFEFYQFKLRQISSESVRKGYVVFETSDSTAYKSITFEQLTSAQVINAFAGSNKLKVLSVTKDNATGKIDFTIWVLGDAEFTVEFYRTYSISYGIYLSDKVSQFGAAGIVSDGVEFDHVEDDMYNNSPLKIAAGSTNARVSYGASFNVRAAVPVGNYQFVGWYVNGYDLYQYLDSVLPDADNLYQKVIVNWEEMPSLVQSNGAEVVSLTLYAVFQPILDVMIYNEKYYAYPDHFNSWDLSTVVASYYDFTRGEPIRTNTDSISVRDNTGKTIENAKEYLQNSLIYQAYEETPSIGKDWSVLLNDATVEGYSQEERSGGYKVYTSYGEFTVLYRNVTDGDVLTDSWTNTSIDLMLTNMSSTAKFISWQYFNWNTKQWTDIAYEYEDRSFGMNPDGTYVRVSCYYSTYSLNLGSLYELQSTNTVLMPYAVSATNSNNMVRYASDVAGIRPLLIRPNLYQTTTVELSQNVYLKDLGDEDPEQNILGWDVISSRILEASGDKAETSDIGRTGTYEYGSTIRIANNGNDPGTTVISGNTRYRFLGWFIKYRDRVGEPYSLYYLANSDLDASGNIVGSYNIRLTCKSDMANTNFLFIALYVAQKKQVVYSYNISGAASESYASAATGENGFYTAAPKVTITAGTSEQLTFKTFDVSNAGTIGYESDDVSKYYEIMDADTGYSVVTKDENGSLDFSATNWSFEYYVDVGLSYDVTIPETASNAITTDKMRSDSVGFCAETDTLYKYMKNREIVEVGEGNNAFSADLSSYYNSGKGIYYNGEKTLTVAEMHALTQAKVGTMTNDKEDSTKSNQYDIMYVSNATLIFYNLTYKGGVSVSPAMASALTGGATSKLTVWDESTAYGDYTQVNNGVPVGLGANGEVVIRVTLITVRNQGYKGRFYFAFAGMQNGKGFPMSSDLSSSSSAIDGLFSPSKDGEKNGNKVFYRWKEVDMSAYATTFLFGETGGSGTINSRKVGTHVATPGKYTTENCGDPVNGYKIYDANIKIGSTTYYQLRTIDLFWSNNDQSCIGVLDSTRFDAVKYEKEKHYKVSPIYGESVASITDDTEDIVGRTCFRLMSSNYQLGRSNSALSSALQSSPTSGVATWTPMCNSTETKSRVFWPTWPENSQFNVISGFDGILDGEMVAGGANYANIIGMIAAPGNISCYGMFSRVCGGVIRNLVVDNAYLASDGAQYVGILAGESRYGTFSEISFKKLNDYARYIDCSFKNTVSNGSRSFIKTGGYAAGCIAGRVIDTKIIGISVEIGPNGYCMEVTATESAGLLVGSAEGSFTNIQTVTVQGSDNSWIFIGADPNSGVTASYAGGLVGELLSGACMQNVTIYNSVNMVVGENYSTTSSGGIVGHIGADATLQYVTFNGKKDSNAENFTYSIDNKTITGKGIFILASIDAAYSNAAANGDKGAAGGLVGWNEGTIRNNKNSNYYTVEGYIKLHAGAMGGIVGGNAGYVTGFHVSAGSSGFIMLAWVINDAYTYSAGGIAGVNADLNSGRENEGLIQDCTFTGTSGTSAADNDWRAGHMYVFLRNCVESHAMETGYKSVPDPDSNPGGAFSDDYNNYCMNIMAGGIVGYNTGSIISCSVNKTKITIPVEHNANDSKSGEDFLKGQYGFGYVMGLIAAYHEPSRQASAGTNYGTIRYCTSTSSVLAVIGRAWMDHLSGYNNQGKSVNSAKYGVSMGGIAGGAGMTTNDYSIYECTASGDEFRYKVKPHGSSSTKEDGTGEGIGWYRHADSGAFAKDVGFSWCVHPYYYVEFNAAFITSALARDDLGANKGSNNREGSASTTKYIGQVKNYKTDGETERKLGGVKWNTLNISENTTRSLYYVESNIPDSEGSSGRTSGYVGAGSLI